MSTFDVEGETDKAVVELQKEWAFSEETCLAIAEDVAALLTRCQTATREAVEEECGADKQRLDELQASGTGYGEGWISRMSTMGRGWRLHETSQHGAEPDIRDAIDNGIHEARRQWEEKG